jgi:hypothetical protein
MIKNHISDKNTNIDNVNYPGIPTTNPFFAIDAKNCKQTFFAAYFSAKIETTVILMIRVLRWIPWSNLVSKAASRIIS